MPFSYYISHNPDTLRSLHYYASVMSYRYSLRLLISNLCFVFNINYKTNTTYDYVLFKKATTLNLVASDERDKETESLNVLLFFYPTIDFST